MLRQEKPPNLWESQLALLEDGTAKGKSSQLELLEGKEDSVLKSTKRKPSPLCSMQESLPIPKKMTVSDKLNFYSQNTQKENWLQKLGQDSILSGEDCSLYWNEYTKRISQSKSIAYSDRLVRLGSPLVEWICQQGECELVVLNERKLSPKLELVEDILSILHCFSSRLYGLRKYKSQVLKSIQEKESEPDEKVDAQQF